MRQIQGEAFALWTGAGDQPITTAGTGSPIPAGLCTHTCPASGFSGWLGTSPSLAIN